MSNPHTTNLPADVAQLLEKGGAVLVSTPVSHDDGAVTYFVGSELTPHKVPPLNAKLPDRVKQSETVIEPASFIDYITAFKSDTAVCFASLGGNKIEAILDYHGRAREGDRTTALPQLGQHRIVLQCPYDVDYAVWRKVFGEKMTQVEIAELIESMIHTIGSPPAADLTEAINFLKIERAVRFKSARNERNGNVQFTYEETDREGDGDGGGQVSLPQEVTVITPIFQGGPTVALVAKLRYRLERGVVVFILAVPGLDKIEREHFRNIGEDVRKKTDTPVFYAA